MNSSLPTTWFSETTTREAYETTSNPTETYSSSLTNPIGQLANTTELDQAIVTTMLTNITALTSTPSNMSTTADAITFSNYNTTYNATTSDPVEKPEFIEEILDWFVELTLPTRIVIITLSGLVVLLALGIIVYCCCRRSRCKKSAIKRSHEKRVCSEERHYTLPNQLQRLTKLRQDFTRRISSLWMDRDVADGESVAGSRIPHSSPRKDRNVRMPSPSPSSHDRPYMDMSTLRKSSQENDAQNTSKDDHEFSYVELDRKPPAAGKLDRRQLPAPPPNPHPKVRNTDGMDSLRLKNIPNVLGDQQHLTYSPQLPAVKYQIVPPIATPQPFSSCQQCSGGSICHYGHGPPAMIQVPIQQPPPVSQSMTMYHNRLFIPEGLSSSPTTYPYGQTETSKPPWKSRLGNMYHHGNVPTMSHCIPEISGYDEDSGNTSTVPNFGYPVPKPRKINEYVIDRSKAHHGETGEEPMYSDPTELKHEDQPTSSSREVPEFLQRLTHLKPTKSSSSGRMSVDLK